MCNSVKNLIKNQQTQSMQNGILSIGNKLPDFVKKAVVTTENGIEITEINHQYASEQGKWTVQWFMMED